MQIAISSFFHYFTPMFKKIESIFEILFSSDGITVKARNLPHRTVSVHKLPLSRVVYNTPLSISLFKNSFAPLFKWSRSEKCHFYVIRYSAGKKVSGADVNAVNGYFYPDTSLIYQPQ